MRLLETAKQVAHFAWVFLQRLTLAERRGACCPPSFVSSCLPSSAILGCIECLCNRLKGQQGLSPSCVLCVWFCALGFLPPHTQPHISSMGISQWAKARIPPGLPTPSHSLPTTPRLPVLAASRIVSTRLTTPAPRRPGQGHTTTKDEQGLHTTTLCTRHACLALLVYDDAVVPSRQGRRPLLCFLHIWGMSILCDLTRLASQASTHTQLHPGS